ncbi:hypothetical protein [Aeribacillus pallidus]|uniref:hypothetical protein n=1 Tax=Aeribacillus pallidus TaxID=33936 RepID=UPI003D1E9B0C
MYTLNVQNYKICNGCKQKKIMDIVQLQNKTKCPIQTHFRYTIEEGIKNRFYISQTSENISFLSQFLLDLNQFPIYILIQMNDFSISEGLGEKLLNWLYLRNSQIHFFDYNGIIMSEPNSVVNGYCLIKITSLNCTDASDLIDFLFPFFTSNEFVSFWLGELPCFIVYNNHIFLDVQNAVIIVGYDGDGIDFLDKKNQWNYEKFCRTLSDVFIIKNYNEVTFDTKYCSINRY